MLDPSPKHPPGTAAIPSSLLATCGTAGQRSAAEVLGEALAKRPPLILLFGEMGVGKSTLLGRFLATVDPEEFAVVQLSATGGEFTGSPSFDVLLEFICRQLVAPQPMRERPATLAVLANAVGTLARAGRAAVIAIDHADHLRDDVISGVARLAKHLDVPPESLVCIFIGSPALASRLDRVLRKPGSSEKIIEIRVSQPSAEELAALLAYEDTAQPGGPMLTPGAIDRISVYAKSNLHWAVPLADAARTLAAAQGEREVSPELVRGALLELWAPDQQPNDIPTSYTLHRDGSPSSLLGISDVSSSSPTGTGPVEAPVSPADEASPTRERPYWDDPALSSAEAPKAPSPWRRKGFWIALALLVLLITIGIVGVSRHSTYYRSEREPPVAGAPDPKPAPSKPDLPEQMPPETASAPVPGAGSQSLPPRPNALDAPIAEGADTPGLRGNETPAGVAPAPNLAPAPVPAPAPALSPPSPREKAPAATKAATAKKTKKTVKAFRKTEEGARGKWIQTR